LLGTSTPLVHSGKLHKVRIGVAAVRNKREWNALKTAPDSVQRTHELPTACAVTNGNGGHLWTVKSSHSFSARIQVGTISRCGRFAIARHADPFGLFHSFCRVKPPPRSPRLPGRAVITGGLIPSIRVRDFRVARSALAGDEKPPSLSFPSMFCSFRTH
jgi:hypothetical protein